MPVGRTANEGPRAHVDQLSTGPWRGRRHSARPIMSIETAQKKQKGCVGAGLPSGIAIALYKMHPLGASHLHGSPVLRAFSTAATIYSSAMVERPHGIKPKRSMCASIASSAVFISAFFISPSLYPANRTSRVVLETATHQLKQFVLSGLRARLSVKSALLRNTIQLVIPMRIMDHAHPGISPHAHDEHFHSEFHKIG